MTVYVTPSENSQGLTNGDPALAAGAVEAPLVTYPISEQTASETLRCYPKTLQRKRPGFIPSNPPPVRTGTEIEGFSIKSQSRLRFVAENAITLQRCSQFVATYHNNVPADGREFKRHVHSFLVALRRKFPFLEYLWAAEMQTRGVPHLHLLLNVAPSEENWKTIGAIWHRIADLGDEKHRWWHCDRIENNGQRSLVPWIMKSGYLCKYLDKAHQKTIPAGFHNFGRWWGNSRKLVPDPDETTKEQIQERFPSVDQETGEIHPDAWKFIIRTLGRYHEKKNPRSLFRKTGQLVDKNGKKFRIRSTSILTGAPIFRQALLYLVKTHGVTEKQIPF